MPRDTPVDATDLRVLKVAKAVEALRTEFVDPGNGKSLIGDVVTSSGGWAGVDSRTGYVSASVNDPGFRTEPGPKNSTITQ